MNTLDKNDWLPVLNWEFKEARHSAVIPLYLAPAFEELGCVMMEINRAKHLAAAASSIPDFSGMVYVMRDRRRPDHVKIGRCKRNAFSRMAKSPHRIELGNTPHEHRQEELILICRGVPASKIESYLHKQLQDYQVENGFGREWFKASAVDILLAINRSTSNEQAFVWIDEFAELDSHPLEDQRLLTDGLDAQRNQFANLSDLHFILRCGDRLETYAQAWCLIDHEVNDNGLPVPVFRYSDECDRSHHFSFIKDVAALGVEPDEAIPDVGVCDGQLFVYRDDQRIERCKSVGHVVNNLDPQIDWEHEEWLVGDEIYEIAFSVRIGVVEAFRRTKSGSLVSEGISRYW